MLTPIDIQNHSLKTAVRGYSKKETDDFLEEILKGYEELYKENRELKDKIASLSEGIQYYKQMETTLQKALVLAEKTSSETQEAAKSKADALTNEAQAKADAILKEAQAKAEAISREAQSESEALRKEIQAYSDVTKSKANHELEDTRNHVRKLVQSYENYRLQFKKLAESQIEMLESEHYSIFAPELSEMLDDAPDADAVMDAEKMVPINAKEDYFEKEDVRKAEQETEVFTEGEKAAAEETVLEKTEPAAGPVPKIPVEKNAATLPGEVVEEAVVVNRFQEEKPLQEEPVFQNALTEEADDGKVDTDAVSMMSEAEKRARAKIKIPDMEITADTIVPGIVPPEKMKAEKMEKERQSVTPKLDDYNQIEISKTVSPSAQEDSPFVFIDTD